MANLKYIGKNILNHDLILKKGNVSGSTSSTGSFGNLNISSDASITGDMVVGGKLTAEQFHTEITSASIIFASGSTLFGDTQDDTHVFTGSLKITGSVTAINLTADSSSISTRLTTEEANVDALQTDSGSFSTRTTTLEAASASFSTRVTTAEAELELTLISGSAQLATQISGAFTDGFEFDGTISGSATSTGSFGKIESDKGDFITGSIGRIEATKGDFLKGLTIEPDDSAHFIRATPASNGYSVLRWNADNGSSLWNFGLASGNNIYYYSYGSSTVPLELHRDTGRVGIGLAFGADPVSMLQVGGGITANGNISGSLTSTGSFGKLSIASGERGIDIGSVPSTWDSQLNILGTTSTTGIKIQAPSSGNAQIKLYSNNGGSNNDFWYMQATNGGTFDIVNYGPGSFTNMVSIAANTGHMTVRGNVSGSATSTGSFGRVEVEHIHSTDDMTVGDDLTVSGLTTSDTAVIGGTSITQTNTILEINKASGNHHLTMLAANNASNSLRFRNASGQEVYAGMFGDVSGGQNKFGVYAGGLRFVVDQSGNIGIGNANPSEKLDVTGNIQASGNISGSATSTGSFGRLETAGVIIDNNNVSATSFTGIFQGALSGSAQIASNISGAFAVASASFAADILSNSSSFAARDTLSEATSSKILNGELEFTNITGSGHISMSLSSTGSFGRVSATTIGGHSPLVIDGETTFINSITSSAHVSSSMTSTASFGRVNVVALGGHQALTIDPITTFTNVITASSAVQLDGKVFIQTGSIEGDLHVRTNENLMRIGKSTSGVIVSGSGAISRFATGSDGSIIDLGFTITDEDGNVVLAGDGDGIHVDSNNYWYNNKYYKVGDGSRNFLQYNSQDGMRYKGELIANTGSFAGEMFINSPTGSMFIGKFTGGIESSGSGNISRFATGSDGSIIDLGFTTTNEEGETVFLSTGDGIFRDSKNYWYTTGHFKIGDGQKQIEWNTTDLNVSASTVDVTTLKASDVNFSNLPTSDPLVTGSLWVSGSSASGSYKSGFVMISGIHG